MITPQDIAAAEAFLAAEKGFPTHPHPTAPMDDATRPTGKSAASNTIPAAAPASAAPETFLP